MSIKMKLAYDEKAEVKKLFSEYTNMLVEADPDMAIYLEIQNYDDELEHLEKKYGLPEGRLYIIYVDDKPAGCVALRKLSEENCELKRLYVRPEFRGNGFSYTLIKKVIDDAKSIGYKGMLLDTLPFLESAIHLYKKFGFYEIGPYNDSPVETTIFMKLDL
ncbi:MAG: GNAT family N-acetyltransferase [Intestinibacter sp.]|uniref:GNAT family N-acetyltransferase n=1 Tax=Intestinibacter sp. TaxID=1965304 RepID=UPI0025BC97B6|nr:GNAT family N-acetyltransferase [Intestinibacter sp.]MCI6737372.1 GNAT family N-acetyltransferase [Intestinibacter sp.]